MKFVIIISVTIEVFGGLSHLQSFHSPSKMYGPVTSDLTLIINIFQE